MERRACVRVSVPWHVWDSVPAKYPDWNALTSAVIDWTTLADGARTDDQEAN